MLWNSIPAQLAKVNRKFIYGLIRQGARAKDYELAMSWLIDCGLIHKITNVTKPAIPLKACEDFGAFKLFLVDIGYVLQQLIVSKETSIYYWSPENARAEVDFLLQIKGKIIPVEVKAAEILYFMGASRGSTVRSARRSMQ